MRKHRIDITIAVIVLLLMAASLVIVFAIGPRVAQALNSQYGTSYDDMYFVKRHAIVVVTSIAALALGAWLKYDKMAKYAKAMLIASALLCLLVTILGKLGVDALVTCDKGACRSLRVPGLSIGFMPSEVFKVAILFYMSWLIRDRKAKGELNTRRYYIPLATVMLLVVVLLGWWESDFGSTVVITFMIFAMMFAGGVELKNLLKMFGVLAAIFLILIFTTPYRIQRILSYSGDDGSDTYHIENALISMGTGGLTGVGLGNSIQSTGYLPEALSDSIFAIICETWGFVGATLVLVAMTVLLWRILGVAQHVKRPEWRLFAVGLFAWILGHVIINVGGMTNLLPMKGITLPFMSYGGTSMVFVAFAVGVVLQISGWTAREAVEEEDENTSSRWGERRTRYAGRSGRS